MRRLRRFHCAITLRSENCTIERRSAHSVGSAHCGAEKRVVALRPDRIGNLGGRAACRRFAALTACGERTASRSLRRPKDSRTIRGWSGRGITSARPRTRGRSPTPGMPRSRGSKSASPTSRWQRRTSIRCTCAPARATCSNCTEALREARCSRCGIRRPFAATGMPLDEIDHECGGRFRPDIVWFGESLPAAVWREAELAAHRAGVILVVGTSAVVYPAAALATHYNDSRLRRGDQSRGDRNQRSRRLRAARHGG